MHNSCGRSAQRPVTVVFVALLLVAGIAVIAASTARAAEYKMVACAGDSGAPPFTTATNTISAQHPSGIFDFNNWCGGAGGDPPGDAAFMRISEHEPNGNAGYGAYGQIVFETPWYVHFKSGGGYTREPNAFNAGWLARYRALDFNNQMTTLLNQGSGLPNSGLDWAASGIFGPHLWPFGGYMDFHHFYFELVCNLPGGCDRANYNAVDTNGFVFILSDDEDSKVSFFNTDSPLMGGQWVRGTQGVFWNASDKGSGMRFERVRVDGADRHVIDFQALGGCNVTSSQTNGEFARTYQPCPTGGPWANQWNLDTATLADGAHSISVCTQDYGQYRGLYGTGGETCDSRTIHVDNNPPGAPAGLHVLSPNPARYLDRFAAQFSLPPDPGSPIAKVHYDVIDATGKVVEPEHVVSGTNPTEIEVQGPAKAGEYRLRVWLEDSVGLAGPAASVPIPHDTTPPAAPQDVAVAPPRASRAAEGFDLRWRDVPDAGSPIDAVHYRVLGATAEPVVPTATIEGSDLQAIEGLDTPRQGGRFTLQLWLSDAEGNVGAPVSVPLSYGCVRSEADSGTALSAAVSPDGKPSVIVAQGAGVALSGKLLDVKGRGVANAPLCVFSKVVTDTSAEFLGLAVTGEQGGYSFALPAGASRELTVAYRPGHREITAEAQAATVVKPTFEVRRKVVHNKGVAQFEGWIPGPDNDNVVVVAQVKRGNGWLAFHRYRTRGDGHFTIEYRFNRTFRPTLYSMRAQIRSQSGYPYLQGTSDPLRLVVLPARHRGR